MQKESGFTIVEVIIVIALLSVMAAVAIPNYLTMLPDMRLKSASRSVKTDLMLAKQRAIRENASVAVSFEPVQNRYRIFLDNGAGGGNPNDCILNGTEVTIKTEPMPEDVTMDVASFGAGAEQCVRIDSRGIPQIASAWVGDGQVRLSNTKNLIRRIRLSMAGSAVIEISADGGGTWSDGE